MSSENTLHLDKTALPTQSKMGLYSLHTRIHGHKGDILCMSVTEDRKLASGGVDGSRVWDLRKVFCETGVQPHLVNQLTRPCGSGDRGATTALSWIRREDEPEDGLIYGTARGLVVCWKEVSSGSTTSYEETYCIQLANPSEITSISFDIASNRLAVTNRNSIVQLFRVGSKLDLHPIFSVVIKDHVPKAVLFGQGGDSKSVYTFGLYDGQIHTLSGSDGKILSTRQTGCKIGNVTSNIRRGVFCIDDPNEGVALYRFDSWERIRTYIVPVEKAMRPRQVTFIEDCKLIVSASDHGTVYVFDRRSGKNVDCLKTCEGDRILAMTATEHLEFPLILSAACHGANTSCSIDVWRKNISIPVPATMDSVAPKTTVPIPHSRLRKTLNNIFFLCLLFMALAFLWQNKQYLVQYF